MLVAESILFGHVLGMYHKGIIFSNDAIIVTRTDQSMHFRDLMLWNKLGTHMRRPEVSWCFTLPTEALFKLTGVEKIH